MWVGRSAVLEQIRRQTVAWQRAASILMARGEVEAALRAYVARERVELVAGAEAAQASCARGLERAARGARRGRADRDPAQRRRCSPECRARAVLRIEGRLGPDVVPLPARDRDDRPVPLALAVGDSLRFGESLPHLGLRNGNRARVEAITAEPEGGVRLRLALEDGRSLEAAWSDLAQQPRFGRKRPQPRIVHAYAGTAYAALGRTSSAAVMYVGAATDAREVYVGLTGIGTRPGWWSSATGSTP